MEFSNIEYSMDISISMDELIEVKVKLAILNKSEISL